MNLRLPALVLAMALVVAPGAARAQTARDSLCYYTDAPRTSRKFALPNGYRLELFRKDSLDLEYGCSATVRNARDSVVWTAEGFGASLAAWTGRDIDNDGYADAVIGIDTGGGNKCCWGYTILRVTPKFGVVTELAFTPFFDHDAQGRTLIREFVPFYDLGMSTAESPAVLLVHQIRNGRLQDVTREHCAAILSDTARRIGSLAWDRDAATPQAMAASRRGSDTTFDVGQTRTAVANIALQYIVCARPKEAEQLVNSTWPSAEAKAEFDSLMSAWAKRAPKRN